MTSRNDDILRFIAEGTASAVGADFFKALARHMAAALGVRIAFVSEFTDVKTRVCMLAYWTGDGFAEPFEYDTKHTPCESVLLGEIGHYPTGVQQAFPLHADLVEEGIESYLAIPMINSAGEVIGHLGAMDSLPMFNVARDLQIFKIFGARAAAELERQHMDRVLAKSRQRLASVLDTAMDAILTIDDKHHVTLFNRAAEQVFRCSSDWAMGQPLERFLAKRFRELPATYFRDTEAADTAPPVWLPDGLYGERADGDEFPMEVTISPMRLGGRMNWTIILRDINERARAESALRTLKVQNTTPQEVIQRSQEFRGVIGESPSMLALLADVGKVAGTDSTVLITGETGTGKEMIARAVHEGSQRRDRPLITVNCAALPTELIESELFGHEKGAFTGAVNHRKGRFELAHGGTIFLDEVGELTAQAQSKLLRVLQEKAFERVGGGNAITVDVRVIAATNRKLSDMVKAGSFRPDLFYRLNVFPLEVPPLRERRSDIPLLTRYFVEKYARRLGKPLIGVAPAALEHLRRYAWPGNVRELQNVIERAAIQSSGQLLDVSEASLIATALTEPGNAATTGTLDEVARSHILRILESCKGVIEGPQGAAAVLGLKPSTLRYRMKLLGIEKLLRKHVSS